MRWRTIRRGPVIVPRVRRPWARLERRCSTTWEVWVVMWPFAAPSSYSIVQFLVLGLVEGENGKRGEERKGRTYIWIRNYSRYAK
jgi:hypothetical protein